jgi:DNA-binding CsgD family transcriptional regulator
MSALQSVEFPTIEGPQTDSFTPGPKLLFCSPTGRSSQNLQFLNKADVCALNIHSAAELLRAVSAAAPDLIVLDFETLRKILAAGNLSFTSAEDLEYALSGLNSRQADIVRMIAKGLRNREIASSLGLSSRTVKAILSSLYLRYDVTNRTELLGLLMEQGHLAATQPHARTDSEWESTRTPMPIVARRSQKGSHGYGRPSLETLSRSSAVDDEAGDKLSTRAIFRSRPTGL